MSSKRRVGIAGFGHLGQHLYASLLSKNDYEVAFVWNRTKDVLQGRVPHDVILDSLEDFRDKEADLIVEVAHPDVTRDFGPDFVTAADYLIGSPTALAEDKVREDLEKCALEHGVYVPVGALWGGEDIRKMDTDGNLYRLQDADLDSPEPCHASESLVYRRQRMTSETVQELESEYLRQPKPDRRKIEEIADRLGQKEINIYAWFYRRRMRDAKDVGNPPEEDDPKCKKVLKSSKKKGNKKSTIIFRKDEQGVLENIFTRQNNPGPGEIAGLAKWFHKDEKKISTWFARRRLKFKKDFVNNLDDDYCITPTVLPGEESSPESLTTDPTSLAYPISSPSSSSSGPLNLPEPSEEDEIRPTSPSQSEDEDCDIPVVIPKNSGCTQPLYPSPPTSNPSTPSPRRRDSEETPVYPIRPNVIRWVSSTSTPQPRIKLEVSEYANCSPPQQPENVTNHRARIGFRTGLPQPSREVKKDEDLREPPGLVPIDLLYRYHQMMAQPRHHPYPWNTYERYHYPSQYHYPSFVHHPMLGIVPNFYHGPPHHVPRTWAPTLNFERRYHERHSSECGQESSYKIMKEALKVTMSKHPDSLKLWGDLETKRKLVEEKPVVLYDGPVGPLCALAPNNVNTMAAAAISAKSLGFQKVQGCLIANPRLSNWHEVLVEAWGPPNQDGRQFHCKTIRMNPAPKGHVTGHATYASFLTSLTGAFGKGPGFHLC